MSIKIKDSTFNGSPLIEGCGNTVNIKVLNENIDWKILQDELIETSAKLPKESKEYKVTKKALGFAMNKDKKGLIYAVKENLSSLTSDIFTGAASEILVKLLMSLVK